MTEDIIQYPHLTEKSMDMVDRENTIVLVVDPRSSKPQIQDAVEERFGVDVARVNTLNDTNGKKKAYVRLGPDEDALDVATRLGML